MDKVKFTFYIPKELSDRLEEVIALYRLRKKEKLTKSHIVEEALKEKLEELERSIKEL